jgi:hypothetical protein
VCACALVIMLQTRVVIYFLLPCLSLEVVMFKFCAGTSLAFFSIFEKLVLLEILQINLYTEKIQRSSIQRKWEWILPFQIGKGQRTSHILFFFFQFPFDHCLCLTLDFALSWFCFKSKIYHSSKTT